MNDHEKVVGAEQGVPRAAIKVIGVGGAGGNAVTSMVENHVEGVDFLIANTDAQALHTSNVETKLRIGMKVTKGLGAGSNPEIGRRAAEEDIEALAQCIAGTDILFLTAGMGGGTGTGATPVIAAVARELGVLTVAVVTKPFMFEGKRRERQAAEAIEQLRKDVDTLIVIPNQKLLEVADPKISMLSAFGLANDVLRQAIQGVSDIIVKPGHINVDFADVKSIMKGMGMAIMGTGSAKGEGRAREAALAAINSSLVEDVCIEGARGILINITGNCGLGLHEINDAASVIYEKAGEDAHIILGSVINPDIGDEVMVTIIATGFDSPEKGADLEPAAAIGSFAHLKKKVALPQENAEVLPVVAPAPAVQAPQDDVIASSPIERLLSPVEQSAQESVEQVVLAQEPAKSAPAVEEKVLRSLAVEEKPINPKPQEIVLPEQVGGAPGSDQKIDAAQRASESTEEKKPNLSSVDSLRLPTKSLDLSDLDTPTFLRKKAERQKN
jgi:cell division protein FtsZ